MVIQFYAQENIDPTLLQSDSLMALAPTIVFPERPLTFELQDLPTFFYSAVLVSRLWTQEFSDQLTQLTMVLETTTKLNKSLEALQLSPDLMPIVSILTFGPKLKTYAQATIAMNSLNFLDMDILKKEQIKDRIKFYVCLSAVNFCLNNVQLYDEFFNVHFSNIILQPIADIISALQLPALEAPCRCARAIDCPN